MMTKNHILSRPELRPNGDSRCFDVNFQASPVPAAAPSAHLHHRGGARGVLIHRLFVFSCLFSFVTRLASGGAVIPTLHAVARSHTPTPPPPQPPYPQGDYKGIDGPSPPLHSDIC